MEGTVPSKAFRSRPVYEDQLLHVVAGVLFLSSFSWWNATVSEYASGGVGATQFIFRVVPVASAGFALLMRDIPMGFAAMRALFSWPVIALLWYALVGAIAGLYSPLPTLAIWKSLEVSVVAYFAAHAYGLPTERLSRLLEQILKYGIVLMLWVSLQAILNPSGANSSHTGRFMISGSIPIINSNGVGTWASISLVAIAGGVRLSRRGWWMLLVTTALVVVFYLARSRTGFAAAILGAGLITFDLLRRDRDNGLLLVSLLSLAGALAFALLGPLLRFLARGQSVESLMELSGRLDYWGAGVAIVLERPWFGGGIATGSRFLFQVFEEIFGTGGVNLHSAPIEIFLSAGLIGGGLLIAFYVQSSLKALLIAVESTSREFHQSRILAAAIVVVLIPRFFLSISLASFSAELILMSIAGLTLCRANAPAQNKSSQFQTLGI